MIIPGASSSAMRPAVLDDLDALVAIDAQCFRRGIAYPRREIAALLRTPASLTLVAERSQMIVGFAALRRLRPRRSARPSPYGELITIDILPEFRREHIGWRLYQTLEVWLIAQGGTWVELHVAVDNTPAIHFYERLGYSMIARIQRYYLETVDAWKMEKILPHPPAQSSNPVART